MDRVTDACLKCGAKGKLYRIDSLNSEHEPKFFCYDHALERGYFQEKPKDELTLEFSEEVVAEMYAVDFSDEVELEEVFEEVSKEVELEEVVEGEELWEEAPKRSKPRHKEVD